MAKLKKTIAKFIIIVTIIALGLLLLHLYKYSQLKLSNIETKQETIAVTSKTPGLTQTGVRIYKPEECYNGYTLFTHMSLELPGTIKMDPIYLIDMKGDIIYQWMAQMWVFHAQLKSDGHLLYTTAADPIDLFKLGKLHNPEDQGHGLLELDPESNVLWYYPAFIEHDFRVLEDGNFLIEQEEPINESLIFMENGISKGPRISPCIEIITPDKKVLWQWRAEEHLQELEELLGVKIHLRNDWAHNNTCEMLKDNPLAKNDTRFHKGNIIFSFSEIDVVGIIDYPTGKIVWAWGPGILDGQHSPTMLDNGNLLIFDNGLKRGWSRVIEVNPITKNIIWEYHSEPKEGFFSREISNALRLPNGNTFICDGSKNRIFEITPEGKIVWDFISTFNKTSGGEGIFHAYRYSPEYVNPLFELIKKYKSSKKNSIMK